MIEISSEILPYSKAMMLAPIPPQTKQWKNLYTHNHHVNALHQDRRQVREAWIFIIKGVVYI